MNYFYLNSKKILPIITRGHIILFSEAFCINVHINTVVLLVQMCMDTASRINTATHINTASGVNAYSWAARRNTAEGIK